jgi:hypothetical protein
MSDVLVEAFHIKIVMGKPDRTCVAMASNEFLHTQNGNRQSAVLLQQRHMSMQHLHDMPHEKRYIAQD